MIDASDWFCRTPGCTERDPNEFYRNDRTRVGLHYYCRACMCERSRVNYALSKGRPVSNHTAEVTRLLEAQNGTCNVCGDGLRPRGDRAQIYWHNGRTYAAVCRRCWDLVKPSSVLGREPRLAHACAAFLDQVAASKW